MSLTGPQSLEQAVRKDCEDFVESADASILTPFAIQAALSSAHPVRLPFSQAANTDIQQRDAGRGMADYLGQRT